MAQLTDEEIFRKSTSINKDYSINNISRKKISGRNRIYLSVTCDHGHTYDVLYDNYVKANNVKCPTCSNQIRATKNRIYDYDYIESKSREHGYMIVGGEFINAASVLKFQCIKCGYIKKANFKNILDGRQCSRCLGISPKDISDINNIVRDIDDEYDVPQNQTYKNCKQKILVRHKVCDSLFSVRMDSFVNCNTRCPKCTHIKSKIEQKVEKLLNKFKVEYVSQKRFPGLVGVNNGNLSYDFYLPKNNILIECQGEQHAHPVEHFGGETQFQIQMEHDRRKMEFARNEKIKLIEIWNVNDAENQLKQYLA